MNTSDKETFATVRQTHLIENELCGEREIEYVMQRKKNILTRLNYALCIFKGTHSEQPVGTANSEHLVDVVENFLPEHQICIVEHNEIDVRQSCFPVEMKVEYALPENKIKLNLANTLNT